MISKVPIGNCDLLLLIVSLKMKISNENIGFDIKDIYIVRLKRNEKIGFDIKYILSVRKRKYQMKK